MDYQRFKKPPQVSEEVWRQHLQWVEVVSKQLDENIARRRKQIARARDSGRDDPADDTASG